MNKTKLRAYLNFYKRIVSVNLFSSILAGMFFPIGGIGIKGFLTTFMLVFFIAGLILGFYFFEWRYKKSYYFYHNLGLSRLQLYVTSFVLNTAFYVPLLLIWKEL